MIPLSEFDTVQKLEGALALACGDLRAIRAVFEGHVRSDFLNQFVSGELHNLTFNPDHIVQRSAGQVSFTLLNTPTFDYTIRLSPPFVSIPHAVKWLGERQILSVKGKAGASFRVLNVPCDINRFEPDIQLADVEAISLESGAFLESPSSNSILDAHEAKAPVVFEVLTIHDERVQLNWVFDEHLKSMYAESSRVICSRLQNIFDLSLKMHRPVPRAVYDAILADGNTQAKLLALESLLVADGVAGFQELHKAIDSDDPMLSMTAQSLLDSIMSRA